MHVYVCVYVFMYVCLYVYVCVCAKCGRKVESVSIRLYYSRNHPTLRTCESSPSRAGYNDLGLFCTFVLFPGLTDHQGSGRLAVNRWRVELCLQKQRIKNMKLLHKCKQRN